MPPALPDYRLISPIGRGCYGEVWLAECLSIGIGLANALENLHQHGLVHRDIKPSNIIFVIGAPKLADVGLVASVDESLTLAGTEGYIPPEGPGSVKADLYSFGKVLYEMAIGKDRKDSPEPPTWWDGLADEPARREFHEVLLKACEPDSRRRYQSASEMRSDLFVLQGGKSVKRLHVLERRLNRLTRLGAVVGGLGVMAVIGFFYQQTQTRRVEGLARAEARRRRRAEEALRNLQFRKGDEFFQSDNAREGLAHLARALRDSPSNALAAERLFSALIHRSFAMPAIGPLRHDAGVVAGSGRVPGGSAP